MVARAKRKISKKREPKKNPLQLEINFPLKTGKIRVKAAQMQFDFYNTENNFFAQLYRDRSKLKMDILRLVIAGKISRARRPAKRMVLFLKEETRRKISLENRSVFKKYGIETATLIGK